MQSASYKAHTAPIFLKLKILQLCKMYIYIVTMFMFKFFKGLLPNIFKQVFTRNEDMNNYITRQSDKLHVPVSKLSAVYRTMKYQGVSFWNVMSTKINNKTYLISNDIPIGTSH